MRELKFRGWIRYQKRMIYADIDTLNNWSVPYSDWSEVMQYTGLKDKKGRLIYEGDILDYQWKSSTRDLLVVEWSNQDACFFIGGVKTDYAVAYGEVIGNIYENPELLSK